jgi:hypothetical protein
MPAALSRTSNVAFLPVSPPPVLAMGLDLGFRTPLGRMAAIQTLVGTHRVCRAGCLVIDTHCATHGKDSMELVVFSRHVNAPLRFGAVFLGFFRRRPRHPILTKRSRFSVLPRT